jgi:hypothetical protein
MTTIDEIENLENKLQKDPQFFTDSIDEDALLADAVGNIFSKSDFVQLKHQSHPLSQMKVTDTKIKPLGNSAIVSSMIELIMPGFKGSLKFTRIWAKLNNQWKIIIFLLDRAAVKIEGK